MWAFNVSILTSRVKYGTVVHDGKRVSGKRVRAWYGMRVSGKRVRARMVRE